MVVGLYRMLNWVGLRSGETCLERFFFPVSDVSIKRYFQDEEREAFVAINRKYDAKEEGKKYLRTIQSRQSVVCD